MSSRSTMILTILTFLHRIGCAAEKEVVPVVKRHWYQFSIGTPEYVARNNHYGIGQLVFIIFIGLLCAFLLLPYERLDGAQSCLTSGLGTYYFVMHIIALPLNILLMKLRFITAIIGFVLAIAAMTLSVNEKFSTLFLSISGGYIITLVLCTLVNVSNYFLYLMTFIPVFVICIVLKKKAKGVHYLVAKALVLTLSTVLIIYLLTGLAILGRNIEYFNANITYRLCSVGLFILIFILFYAFAYLKEKLEAFRAKK